MNTVGIPPVNMGALPRILLSEKQKIIPDAAAPAKWRTSSVPLFWGESKSEDFRSAVIDMLDIGMIYTTAPLDRGLWRRPSSTTQK